MPSGPKSRTAPQRGRAPTANPSPEHREPSMYPIRIETRPVRDEDPVTRLDPKGAPFEELAAARIQLLGGAERRAHAYEDSEVLLTGVDGEVEVGDPGRGQITLRPGACVMVPRGELFTLANRTSRPATLLAVLTRGAAADRLPRAKRTTARDGRHLKAVA
ncbi:cupin domain-containing protein [Streptomyces sp. TRM66268-LWL]|uniref:Cupin domain-containing protein n=1 Tax=Streptomyces polyasparticus TaxID=2767826 RepID=A0ABR7SFS2_9ACTN|nr:cupin domain-containing protein [Streptomyces polyasparticus]MBC9713590.1 cupin domain-containing protein [Streptomyces polyasparticus]